MSKAARPSVDQALALIWDATDPLGAETIPIGDAVGRITAGTVRALRDTPAFRASAMDGFALRSADTRTASQDRPIHLRLHAPVFAGAWPQSLPEGVAVAISTGAAAPEGADTILVREAAQVREATLIVSAPVAAHKNLRLIGEDAVAGAEIAPGGLRLSPAMIGALVAYGLADVSVQRLPRIGLISTGSELTTQGAQPSTGALVDSNAPMIRSALTALGLPADFIGIAADDKGAIDTALDAASNSDLVLSTGGVSAGDLDLVRARLEARGAQIVFHGVRMRPGKPLLLARLKDGRAYLGLPGTPVAALATFRFFAMHAIRRLSGLGPEAGETISHNGVARDGTTLFLRARRVAGSDGRPIADTILDQRPHILRSVFAADLWLRLDADEDGERATAYPFSASL